MHDILFVCDANRFRSIIAAEIFRSLLDQKENADNWNVRSAGIWAQNGIPPLKEAVKYLSSLGLDGRSRLSSEITREIADASDLIVAMTASQCEAITSDFKESQGKVYLFSEICSGEQYDIPDPFSYTDNTAEEIASEINSLITAGFERIIRRMDPTIN